MSGGARVPIPNNVRKTIEDIREITGKQHTDDEIYAVLRECSMDPNETIQKLLYLDTFHEVRRRRDRKKEGFSSRGSEDSRSKHGGQGRGGRGGSGGYSSNFSDGGGGGGGRNHAIRRENGVNYAAERSQKPKANTASQATRVPAVANHGTTNLSNGKSGHSSNGQSFTGNVPSVPKSSAAANGTGNQENVQPQVASVAAASSPSQTFDSIASIGEGKSLSSADQLQNSAAAAASGVYSSSLDPVLVSSISCNPGVTCAISKEVGSQRISAGANHVKGNKVAVNEVGDLPAPKNENSVSVTSTTTKNAQYKPNEVENSRLSEPSRPSSSSSLNGSLRPSSSSGSQPPPANVTEVSTSEICVQSSSEPRQHVTFPNHFQVPEALKTGLTFGSFDTLGSSERSSSGTDGDNTSANDSSLGNDKDAISRDQRVSLTAQDDRVDFQHSSSFTIEKTPASEGNSITSTDSKVDHPKQEVFLAPEGHPILNVQSAQNYGLNFMSTMLGTQQVQYEGTEPQSQEASHFNNFVNASSQAVSSPSPTPPLQSSIGPVPTQSVPMFRPPYPANFFPYGHYYPPIYVSPIHQFLSHNGFPQQPSAGNMYLPAAAAAAAAGIKFPLPQFKAGANTGNTAHLGIPSGSFISQPVGYAPSPTVNTGSSAGNEDLSVPQLKENQIYTTGQQSEGSAVWLPAPGQDISSLQVNSLYNLTAQGQHLPFPPPQAGHGAFPGIYPPGQTVVSPSTLLQQSQAVAGPVETVGPPSGSYHHQPQPAQINWNSNF